MTLATRAGGSTRATVAAKSRKPSSLSRLPIQRVRAMIAGRTSATIPQNIGLVMAGSRTAASKRPSTTAETTDHPGWPSGIRPQTGYRQGDAEGLSGWLPFPVLPVVLLDGGVPLD